jgi:hypothetical protein
VGAFEITVGCLHGHAQRQHVHNMLMWRSHARLLRRMLPPRSGGPFTFEIGFSGPQLRGYFDRPNWDPDPYVLDRRGKASDFVGDWGNEGCSPAQDVRDIVGYARQAVTWTATDDEGGVAFTTGWHTWTNRVQWLRKGDWTPPDWDPLWGSFSQPWPWTNCERWEICHGYPWSEPRIHPDWWKNTPPPQGKSHPDNRNDFNVECQTCALMSPYQFGGYRNACVFVLIKGGGYETEALAAAQFKAPISWHFGGIVSVQYASRFGH